MITPKKTTLLRRLLEAPEPVVLAGVQDGLSAALAERAGFTALWASGFCISASMKIPDVGLVSMGEHLAATREIDRATTCPVVADVDDGFGDAINVARMVREYEAAGIAAVCIEDNQHPKRNSLIEISSRRLVERDEFVAKIRVAKAAQTDPDFIVIARTEAFVARMGLEEALDRANAYADAGADMVLVHSKGPTADEVRTFSEHWTRDVPLVAVPTLYPEITATELNELGYRMVIFANQGMRAAVRAMDDVFRRMAASGTLTSVESDVAPLKDVFSVVGYDDVYRLEAEFMGAAPERASEMHDPQVTTPSLGAGDNLPGRLILDRPDGLPSAPALGMGDLLLTYADLRSAVERAAGALRSLGVAPGARVALVIPNSPEYVVAILAVTALGATAVPVDPNVGPDRLAFIMEETEPALCLCDAALELPALGDVPRVTIEIDRSSKIVSLVRDGAPIEPVPGAWPEVGPETPAIILFSAGSTGRPKGVVLKHRHLVRTAEILAPIIEMDADHRELIICPMTHSGGWQRASATLMHGGCVFIPEGFLAVPTILEAIETHGIRGFFTTPPFLRTLLRTAPEKIRARSATMRSIEIASAPVAATELAQLMELFGGIKVFLQYGLTECSRALILNAHEFPGKLHTIGRPTPGCEVMIAGADGAPLGPGETGEILLKAVQRTDGYYNAPRLNEERFRDGWLMTGDFGSVDDEGFVTFSGRRDDVINCGGLSYFPAEAEMELGPVEGLKAYMIAGVPDPQKLLGDVPWAFVVPNDPDSWEPKTFLTAARAKLPPHMIPRFVKVIDAIVMTGPSKPNRRLTVEKFGPDAEMERTP